jgi:hypothetical protein
VEAGGRSVWTPRDTPEARLRLAFVADPDGNLAELLSSDELDEELDAHTLMHTRSGCYASCC